MLQNENFSIIFVAKIWLGRAETEPLKVWASLTFRSLNVNLPKVVLMMLHHRARAPTARPKARIGQGKK